MSRKFLLIICEGLSDQTTLYKPTKNFISKKNINIMTRITDGDISLKDEATLEGCIYEIQSIIKFYKDNYNLLTTDFFGVYHIIDTDGALSQNDIYVQCDSGYYIKDGLIYTEDIEKSKKINDTKREIITNLANIKQISDVNYKVLFFSRNLEHDLYNKPVCTVNEKKKLSNDFELKYAGNAEQFYKIIETSQFSVPSNYDESWAYILDGTNSLNRGTNYLYLLNEIKKQKK